MLKIVITQFLALKSNTKNLRYALFELNFLARKYIEKYLRYSKENIELFTYTSYKPVKLEFIHFGIYGVLIELDFILQVHYLFYVTIFQAYLYLVRMHDI